MPLPIALGGKCESAQHLPGPCCHPEDREDGTPLQPLELYQTLAWGVCPKNEWLVRVTASYYDLIVPTTGAREITMVEVRVQVSFLTRPLSPNYRETSHHLKLFDGAKDEYPQSQPQVLISEDRRNLAVLLFHPHQQSSAVVIFQLRIPRSDLTIASPIPLPSYCAATGNDNNASSVFSREAPMVASHPRFVSVWGISTLCSIPNVSPPILLAVCHDGGLVWLDVRSSLAVASGMLQVDPKDLPFSSIVAAPTSSMESGTLLAVSSKTGRTTLATWKIEKKSRVEQTFLKRASTGAVVVQVETPTPSVVPETSKIRKSDSRPPVTSHFRRKTPIRSLSGGATPHVQRALKSVFSPERMKSLSPMFTQRTPRRVNSDSPSALPDLAAHLFGKTEKEKMETEKRKQHMDTFVMKELQKKTEPDKFILKSKSPTGPVRRRRQSATGSTDGKDTLMRSMQLSILSTLDEEVAHARFGAISTIVCAVYRASSKKPRVAQIFSLCELGTFQSVVTLMLASEQVDQATDVARKITGPPGDKVMTASISSQFGSDHDSRSDCFAINTTYEGRWVGCLWNWRSNVLGWMIQNSTSIDRMLWSRLYFSKHAQQGSHFAYLESTQQRYLQTRKEVVATGLLSPSDSYTIGIEPCSLLLSSDSISFPDASQRETGVSELEWKASKLPFMYLNAYGPPRVAAVGRLKGSEVAVASSCGVCILDSKQRWKQFGSPAEEKTFSIVAMTWWEGPEDKAYAGGHVDEEFDDLLVAVIQSNNGRQYLSCWSPHRLDLAHQLLETPQQRREQKDETSQEPAWGIPLTKSVKASNISLLAEPGEYQGNTSTKNQRRAVVFVSSTDTEECSVDYAVFQLQLTKTKEEGGTRAESYVEEKPYSVLVNLSTSGTIKNGLRSVGPVSSLFLAGASFKFDIEASTELEGDSVAVVGMVREPGGIEAVALSSSGKPLFAPLIDADEVSRVSLIDIVHTPPHTFQNQGPTSNCFIWLIQLLSGAIFTWSAPYLVTGESGDDLQCTSFLRESKIPRPKGLRPPTLVWKKESQTGSFLGTLCHIGNASDWMQQGSSGCQTDMSIGNVPRSVFGCVLRAGQTSRKLHRNVADDFETDIFPADFLEPDVYGPTSFMMTPPAFVSSLYALFLEAAYLRTEIPVMEESKVSAESTLFESESGRLKAIERHIDYRLRASPNEDAVMMGLRLLITRSVEMLAAVNKKYLKERSDVAHSSLLLASSLFSEVVDSVRRCTTNLQFASLFLEAARQIEPSCLAHLFPLPVPGKSHELEPTSSDSSVSSRWSARTVMELFTLCVDEGSLAASASALPLMGSRIEARNYCDLLLARSIESFINNTHASFSRFDTSQEERRVIGDIFRYGMKLEDSGRLEEKMLKEEEGKIEEETKEDPKQLYATMEEPSDIARSSYATLDDPDDSGALGGDASSVSTETPTASKTGQSLICIGGRNSSILNYLVPSIFDDPKEEEEAIRNAATSFIDSPVEPSNLDFLVQPGDDDDEDDDVTFLPKAVGNYDVQSVGGLVGDVLVKTFLTPKTDCKWKAMASLARLLLQNGAQNTAQVFIQAGESVRQEELEELVPGEYQDDGVERLGRFLSMEMEQCQANLNQQQAQGIVDLVLQLLGRLADFPLPKSNHSLVTSGLLLLGLIAGHAAGRTPILVADLEDDHVMVVSYAKALENKDAVQ